MHAGRIVDPPTGAPLDGIGATSSQREPPAEFKAPERGSASE